MNPAGEWTGDPTGATSPLGGPSPDSISFSRVYDELRRLAAARLSREAVGATLQPTALVHDAWLRLGGDAQPAWQNRAHFFGAAAEAMRRILIDRARRRQARRRAGLTDLVEDLPEDRFKVVAPDEHLLAVHEALDRLAVEDPEAATLVKLRFFLGMSMPEVANVTGRSLRSLERTWTFARAWLRDALTDAPGGPAGKAGD